MSFYNLGKGIFNSETHLVIAHAVNEETAKNLVDILNAKQQSVQENGLWNCPNGDARAIKANYSACPICGTPRAG